MPVQKGKRNRHRPRGKSRPIDAVESPSASARQSSGASARPVQPRRSLFQGSPGFNAGLGAFMLVVGIVFFFVPGGKGVGLQERLLFLIGYLLLGGFYLFRAYRGYRRQPR
jgi:hypothetical protein